MIISNNNLSKLDKNLFKNVINLKRLSFSKNEIFELDYELFDSLENLEVLYIDHNLVTS